MKKIIFIAIAILSFSCKNEANTRETNTQEANTEETKATEVALKDNILKISINIVVPQDDKLQLFYVDDDPEGNFNPDKRLAINVKANDNAQKITFSLPEGVFPYKLRLDLGENSFESAIYVNSINLELNNNVIDIENEVLERFFQPNIYLEREGNGFNRKVIDGRCDPFLLSTELLIKKMELEL